MTENIFLFPGQSSWRKNMFDELREIDREIADRILQQVVDLSGFNPDPQATDLPEISNLAVQLGIFTANHIYLEMLHSRNICAAASAGLSLGEYNHLVHIKAISFEECVGIIMKRGQLYDEGPAGAMAALLSLSESDVLDIIKKLSSNALSQEVIYISNYNSPTQFVVAGSKSLVERATLYAEDEYYATGVVIDESRPMHTPMFRSVTKKFSAPLNQVDWKIPKLAYYPNVSGEKLSSRDYKKIPELLLRHVTEPVQWRRTIDSLFASFKHYSFVEVGPGTVIYDLLSPKWHSFARYHTAAKNLPSAEHFKRVTDELR